MLGLAKVLDGDAVRMGVTPFARRGEGKAYLYDHDTPRELTGARHTAYVKIAEGCDRPCGFCIIPKLRGSQRSRTMFSVVEEVAHLVADHGTREVCLVAQDLTTYGSDLEPAANLELLLDALCRIDGLAWIRLHYAYPTAVTEGLVRRIANEPKVATYLDVPMQHIDSDVLKRMRRGYGERQVRELVDALRDPAKVGAAHVWLRTTMLVGHPGETETAYRRLYDFVEEGQIDHLGVFPWSREDGTPSALLPIRVPSRQAEERAAALMELQAGIRAKKHAALVGRTMAVLVDGVSTESDLLLDGRHEGQAPGIDGKVVLTDGTAKIGSIVQAVVTQASAHDLVASLDPDAAALALASSA
jgi:ribosomal protein S12 methylthiotransferase